MLSRLRDHLRAVVLLGGAVRPTLLSNSIGRSVFDLPVSQEDSILDLWCKQTQELLDRVGLDHLPLRVVIDRDSIPPAVRESSGGAVLTRVEVDETKFRGTGGVLRELCSDYGDKDLILVASGAQVLMYSLIELVMSLAQAKSDVSIVSHIDGSPSGLMLVRCGVLGLVPAIGFIDMKEQALPIIADKHRVTVVERAESTGLTIRTLYNYVSMLRKRHRSESAAYDMADEFLEDWQPAFGIIEPGAEVDPTARVHDSVVLSGGRVERGATLVRSLVCPGGVAGKNKIIVDQIVGPNVRI